MVTRKDLQRKSRQESIGFTRKGTAKEEDLRRNNPKTAFLDPVVTDPDIVRTMGSGIDRRKTSSLATQNVGENL